MAPAHPGKLRAPLGPASASPSPATQTTDVTINEQVIRWSEIRLPHPTRDGELVRWKVDGPFALRSYYRMEGVDEPVRLDLSRVKSDGTIDTCLHCGGGDLTTRIEAPWVALLLWVIVAVGFAPFTYGASVLIAAYPVWFLWGDARRVQICTGCRVEYVDFRHGPRP